MLIIITYAMLIIIKYTPKKLVTLQFKALIWKMHPEGLYILLYFIMI